MANGATAELTIPIGVSNPVLVNDPALTARVRASIAKVVGVDKLTDLAVLKVNASDLPTIAWGDSTQLEPGQTVLAFGSPFGYFQFSVTRGIVSPSSSRDARRSCAGTCRRRAAPCRTRSASDVRVARLPPRPGRCG